MVHSKIEKLIKHQWGRLLAGLICQIGDFQLAEDSLQDAVESALIHWTKNGLPTSPGGWLMKTARRKAIDRIRRDSNFARKQRQYQDLISLDSQEMSEDQYDIPDERLRLIFTCCHPALKPDAQCALTLKTLCGLTTLEIARAFVVNEEAMAQRIVRAKKKIRQAAIPYKVPETSALSERLNGVLDVIYLIFNEGYRASLGASQIRQDLCHEAHRLAGLLCNLMPDACECHGLKCLIELHLARMDGRIDGQGHMVSLEDQNRSLWHLDKTGEVTAKLEQVLALGKPGPYQLQAAIAAIHCESSSFHDTDWLQIAALYQQLYKLRPNPVVELNRIIALSYVNDLETVFCALAKLSPALNHYQPYHAARADILMRMGHIKQAEAAYLEAIEQAGDVQTQQFLQAKMGAMLRNSPGDHSC